MSSTTGVFGKTLIETMNKTKDQEERRGLNYQRDDPNTERLITMKLFQETDKMNNNNNEENLKT